MEISVAVNYILSHLYTKLPRRRVDNFGEELERYLHIKFQHHWYPNDPVRDAPHRCLNVVGPQVDLLFPEAAAVSGLDWNEIQACLPEGLVITIDPGHVACQYNQQMFPNSEYSRFNSTQFWPSAPLSLSSSGCSSASSSISSSNVTPNSNQVTHQVLYCVQDGWLPCNTAQFPEVRSAEDKPEGEQTTDFDHNDHLATATALSVLAENDDLMSGDTNDGKEYRHTKTLWTATNAHEANQKPRNIAKTGSDLTKGNNIFDTRVVSREWTSVDSDTDSTLLAILNAEGNTYSAAWVQTLNPTDKAQLIALLSKANTKINSVDSESSIFGGTNNCSSSVFQATPSKYDPSISPSIQPLPNPLFNPHPAILNSTNHFVQKSTSTPSFTAATFAQTKFGSTKLKNHAKRTPNRIISPTNMQQSAISSKAVGSTLKDSVVPSLVNNNLRPYLGTPFDANSLQGQTRKSIIPGENCLSLDSAMTAEEKFNRSQIANVVGAEPIQMRAQFSNQVSILDDFLTSTSSVIESNLMGKYNFTDAFHGGINRIEDHSNFSWQNGFDSNLGTKQFYADEWLQPNPVVTNIGEIKRPIACKTSPEPLPLCQEHPRVADLLTEENLLSTQMVNLLLEDNVAKDISTQNGFSSATTTECNSLHAIDNRLVKTNQQNERNPKLDATEN